MNRLQNISIEAVVAWIVIFFMLLFAMWTLMCHAATFFYIPWQVLSRTAAVASLPATLMAAWGAWKFSNVYCEEIPKTICTAGFQSFSPIVLFIVIAALLLVAPTYGLRFSLALIGLIFMWWLARKDYSSPQATVTISESDLSLSGFHAVCILVAFTFIAVIITSISHRPDLDDTSFIQIATQTMRHPELAPLTFDASLGFILEPFRFAPYRLASYETLVALLAVWTGIDILNVYYIFLPGLTAALTIGVAYLFTRWFLPSGPAVLATGIFLLIILSWGETHRTYGNFVFVRLFQGKGLLIALTTPLSIVIGLLLLRRPSLWNWMLLVLAQVAAIGVSSSGLICTFVTTALVLVTSIRYDYKAVFYASAILASILIYPAILGIWLKISDGSVLPLSKFGTYLPVNASLGFSIREVLSLCALALGFGALRPSIQKREYGLLAGAVLVLIFNPWFFQLLSGVSARNMSWRLAWAAPTPLLMAVAFTAFISPLLLIQSVKNKMALFGSFIGVAAVVVFLVAGRWTLATSNNVALSWPSAKLPAEYNIAKEIAVEINKLNSPGTVLANREIGAWFPLVAPELKLVMPGHTYSAQLKTVLPSSEFDNRNQLYKAINGQEVDRQATIRLMKHYSVGTMIMPNGSPAEKTIEYIKLRTDITIKEIPAIVGYRLFFLTYESIIIQ